MTARPVHALVCGLALLGLAGPASASSTGEQAVKNFLHAMGAQDGDYTMAAVTAADLDGIFPGLEFYAVVFEQYPLAVEPPPGLSPSNVVVTDGHLVLPLTDPEALKAFFMGMAGPASLADDTRMMAKAWLRLTPVFSQDGYFAFSEPKLPRRPVEAGAISVEAKVTVTAGGHGHIIAFLVFDPAGALVNVVEERHVVPGIRPL
jgi:hypothetical protein